MHSTVDIYLPGSDTSGLFGFHAPMRDPNLGRIHQ